MQELYSSISWPLYKLYGHAFDAFKLMAQDDGATLFARLEAERGGPIPVLTEPVREALLRNIKRRMTPQALKIRADVELTCFQYDGIEHIKVGRGGRRREKGIWQRATVLALRGSWCCTRP